ncbi:MAG: undecaprenyl/decaprenyl-phosphate alpha-N-acetylglucosaminyl 1-phosphate transferase [Lewinellaceae bacterium]|nr:undecaprenyl/decaprenyl-phosphate alpha-N-acetylglucosaminyl 1-phosphate transferase [Lewinellaceae bacterium]
MTVALCLLTAFAITFLALPSVIQVARIKNLYDVPTERSSHSKNTPSLGGVGIFAGAVFSIIFWTDFQSSSNMKYALCSMIIIFLIGLKDDLLPLSPWKKLLGQVLAAVILVFLSGYRLHSFYGFLGFDGPLPIWISAILSVFLILVISNAFNLIDGINGLAGSISCLTAGAFGSWFWAAGFTDLAVLSFALVGAVLAFLRFNLSPASIFMGDTGSLFIGLILAVLTLRFLELNSTLAFDSELKVQASPTVAIGILIIPLFDTIRVFITRIIRGQSPFRADRRHIHHLLVDFGFSHTQATGLLVLVNCLFICFVVSMSNVLELHFLLAIILSVATVATLRLHLAVLRKQNLRSSQSVLSS